MRFPAPAPPVIEMDRTRKKRVFFTVLILGTFERLVKGWDPGCIQKFYVFLLI